MTTVEIREVKARDLMSAPVLSLSPDDTPFDAWQLMTTGRVRHLALTVDDRCVGLVDDRTVLALWPMGPVAIRQARIGDYVRRHTSCVLPDTSAHAVARVMIEDGVDAVPVVDDDGHLLGLVTSSDIVAAVAGCDIPTNGDAGCRS
jgi:CBS domain-containing protein